ncbi:MAG: M36 family metallopeptidase [Planctomycetota bacterium]
MSRPLTSLLVVLLAAATPLFAQGQQGPTPARTQAAHTLAERQGASVRWDTETGTPARIDLERGPVFTSDLATETSRWLEQDLAPLFDAALRTAPDRELAPLGSALVLREARDLGADHYRVVFDQLLSGVPVQGGMLLVELERAGLGWRPVRVAGRYFPGLDPALASGFDPAMQEEMSARYPTWSDGELTVETTCSRVILVRGGEARAALRVDAAAPEADGSHLRRFVDAGNGEEMDRHAISCQATAEGLAYRKNPGDTPREKLRLPNLYVYQGGNRVTTDANGVHTLAGQVSLDQALSGPRVRVFAHQEDELQYMGPADLFLQPTEGSTGQDELAAFFHYNNFNMHLRATYARFASSNAINTRYALLVRYKQNGRPLANAFFTPQNVTAGGESFTGYLAMGTFGNNQAARSASVVQHEYCHALYSQIVDLNGNLESGGLNEGLADYFPAVFHEDPVIGGWLVGGNGIRDLRSKKVFPQDGGEVHRIGWIFAGALWRARTAIKALEPGDEKLLDQAVCEAVFRMRDRPSLLDAREAVIAGDKTVSGGKYRVAITDSFATHGIGPAAQNQAPVLDPIGDQTVKVGETLRLTVKVDDKDQDPVQVTVSPLQNADLDQATLEFTFRPDASQVGTHQVTFTATDNDRTVDETITITVDPAPAPLTPAPAPGGLALPASTTAPATSGSGAAAPAATAPSSGNGGGGGGGGCSLRTSDAPASGLGALLLCLVLVALRRREASLA